MRPGPKRSQAARGKIWRTLALLTALIIILAYAIWTFRTLKEGGAASAASSSSSTSSSSSSNGSSTDTGSKPQQQSESTTSLHDLAVQADRARTGEPPARPILSPPPSKSPKGHRKAQARPRLSPPPPSPPPAPPPSSSVQTSSTIVTTTTKTSDPLPHTAAATTAVQAAGVTTASSSGSIGGDASVQPPGPRDGRSCGSQMTRGVKGGGKLFSWGLNEFRLARETGENTVKGGDNSIPEAAMPDLTVISVASSRHTAFVTMEGHVWTCGHNDSHGGGGHGSPPMGASGQLGRGGSQNPGRVLGALEGKFVVQAVTGRYHSLAITDTGEVYTWGLNDHGQLGRRARGATGEHDPTPCTSGPSCHDGAPGLVDQLVGLHIVGASAGRYNTLLLDSTGVLHVWGLDGCAGVRGELPALDERWRVRQVKGALAGKRVVAADSGYVFWIAATEDGMVVTCATQDDGYAGTLATKVKPNDAGELGRDGDPFVPLPVPGMAGKKVVAVASGREHAIVATAEGEVWSWGGRNLLLGRDGDPRVPGKVAGALENDKVLFVAGGEYFSLAASSSMVYGWGSNDYLATGVGRHNPVQELKGEADRGNVLQPAPVTGPLAEGKWRIWGLSAGYQHALAIAAPMDVGGQPLVKREAQSTGAGGAATATGPTATTGGTGTAAGAVQPALVIKSAMSESATSAATTSTAAAGAGVTATGTADPQFHTSYLWSQPASSPKYSVAEYWANWRPLPHHEEIVATARDVFDTLPKAFDPKYKSPCWTAPKKDGPGDRLRCLPYYHILGVSKCGTTDLYNRLARHPQILESKNKGPHWWDECPYPAKEACTAPPNGDFDGYIDLFTDVAAKVSTQDPTGISGDASSNTYTSAMGVYLRGGASHRTELNVTMPQLLRAAQPYLRLIAIFRDPVDRYFSAFYYYRWWKTKEPTPGPEDFHKTTVEEIQAWKNCVENHGQAPCVRRYNPQQLVKGMYSEFLEDWLRSWPRDQLLLLRNEDYKNAQRDHMQAVFNFLGVRNLTDAEWEPVMRMEAKNKNSDKYQPMWNQTRTLLEEFYRPFNKRLAELLRDDRFLWTSR